MTGLDRRARGLPVTLGVNVRLSGFGDPPDALTASAGRGTRSRATKSRAVAEPSGWYGSALAVRLWRDSGGVARMTCPHVVRHSPSGPEWGYGGSGPADCARSVLRALAGGDVADAHYQAFKAEVVARLPEEGAVITRTDVAAWLAGRAGATVHPVAGRAA